MGSNGGVASMKDGVSRMYSEIIDAVIDDSRSRFHLEGLDNSVLNELAQVATSLRRALAMPHTALLASLLSVLAGGTHVKAGTEGAPCMHSPLHELDRALASPCTVIGQASSRRSRVHTLYA